MLSVIVKKNNRRVLKLLDKFGELYYGELKKALKIDSTTLSMALNELVDNKLIKRREEPEPSKRIPKVYYSLTSLGKEALEIYELAEELERKREAEVKENFGITINGDVNGGIIIGNNSKVHIKKH
jgi:DNA-binding HxlR family transcriptional regulator